MAEIIWKLLYIRAIFDHELIKLFIENNGHEAVIEILLSKQKGNASKVLIRFNLAIYKSHEWTSASP